MTPKKIEPLFPFGFGLSYTTFEYSDLSISTDVDGAAASVQCIIENRGEMAGTEIVQLYIRDPESSVMRPLKELKGFERVELKPGERQSIEFSLGVKDLSFWDEVSKAWKAEAGLFEVLIGASSRDIRLRGQFEY